MEHQGEGARPQPICGGTHSWSPGTHVTVALSDGPCSVSQNVCVCAYGEQGRGRVLVPVCLRVCVPLFACVALKAKKKERKKLVQSQKLNAASCHNAETQSSKDASPPGGSHSCDQGALN